MEVEVAEKAMPFMPIMAPGMEDMAQGLNEMMNQLGNNPIISMLGGGPKKRKRKLKVKEALELLTEDEAARMVDMERVTREALDRAQNAGIVFIDEIDKIAGREGGHGGPDVSRGGWRGSRAPRSSRWKRRSSPRSATSGATSTRWCATSSRPR